MVDGHLRLPLADADRLQPYDHDEFDRVLSSRARRGGYLLNQVRYLLIHQEVALAVKEDVLLFPKIISMLSTFVGINTQYHALGSHIRYEADYGRSFTILSDISHVGKDLANCFLRFPKEGPISATAPLDQIRQVMRRICADTKLETEVLNKAKYMVPAMHTLRGVLLPQSTVDTFDQQIWGITAFSFHHFLHYFLGELTKSLFKMPYQPESDSLRAQFVQRVFDHKTLNLDGQMLLVIDHSLTSESREPETEVFECLY